MNGPASANAVDRISRDFPNDTVPARPGPPKPADTTGFRLLDEDVPSSHGPRN